MREASTWVAVPTKSTVWIPSASLRWLVLATTLAVWAARCQFEPSWTP